MESDSGAASWNPALRPNSDKFPVPATTTRTPDGRIGATRAIPHSIVTTEQSTQPEESTPAPEPVSEVVARPDSDCSPTRLFAITRSVTQESPPKSGDGSYIVVDNNDGGSSVPNPPLQATHDASDLFPETPGDSWAEITKQEPLEDITSRHADASGNIPQTELNTTYESQSQSTFLEDAVAEDPTMPLVTPGTRGEATIEWPDEGEGFLDDELTGRAPVPEVNQSVASEAPSAGILAPQLEPTVEPSSAVGIPFVSEENAASAQGGLATEFFGDSTGTGSQPQLKDDFFSQEPAQSTPGDEAQAPEDNFFAQEQSQSNTEGQKQTGDDFFAQKQSQPEPKGQTQPADDFFSQEPSKPTSTGDFFSSHTVEDSGTDFFALPQYDTASPSKASRPEPANAEDMTKMLWDSNLGNDDFLGEEANGDDGFFLDDDDEGFLEDEPAAPEAEGTTGVSGTDNRYAPQDAQQQQSPTPTNIYTPQATHFTDLTTNQPAPLTRSQTMPQVPFGAPYGQSYQHRPSLPAQTTTAESFVAKSRGGYSSPFDLPEDLTVPRRRPMPAPLAPVGTHPAVAAPPRSSSIGAGSPLAPPRMDHASSTPQSGFPTPPSSSSGNFPLGRPAGAQDRPTSSASASKTNFFEDLPVVARSRQSPRPPTGPMAPVQPGGAQQAAFPTAPSQNFTQPPAPPRPSATVDYASLLQQPQKVSPYADLDSSHARAAPAVQASRYSPTSGTQASRYSPAAAPSAPQTGSLTDRYGAPPAASGPVVPPPAQNRYASAPTRSVTQPFAPRTSSPLAQHSTAPQPQPQQTQEPGRPLHANYSANFPAGSAPPATDGPAFTPPRRSMTQSPGSAMKGPRFGTVTTERRPSTAVEPLPPTSAETPGTMHLSRRRGFTLHENANFIEPQDDRSADPLQRWKGYPVFAWGMGGTYVSSFPLQIPRYGGGSTGPMLKCAPGEVHTKSVRAVFPLPERLAKFPGPLKKNKKKEVLAWLKAGADAMDNEMRSMGIEMQLGADGITKMNEKILLWRLLGLLVEHDGVLEGTPAVEQATRKLFTTENVSTADVATPYGIHPESSDSAQTGPVLADSVDSTALSTLRESLAAGEKDKAVWYAVDQRLWGHAMLIASTLSRDLWKQVVQEFVRKEVQKAGPGNEALGALYETFAGNWDESVDQLVPVSARAGFQMVSKSEPTGAARNQLAGLDKWQETLLLILNNRTPGDAQALVGLGKLLIGYGRVEAAHICYLFARSLITVGGSDDPRVNLTLIGADAQVHGPNFGQDLEAIVLTEIYEFALSLSTPGQVLPHLQGFKLHHALVLAESGYREGAQQYCDAITTIITSKHKPSPYYHQALVSILDDLSKRLSEAPKEASSGWMSRPNMDKVSGSLWEKVANFVAGDENDGASTGSGGKNEVGPFAKIAGDTPTVSRSASVTDLYGAATYGNGGASLRPSTGVSSKYAPGNTTQASKTLYRPHSAAPISQPPVSPYAARPETESPTMYHHPPSQAMPKSPYAPIPAAPQANGSAYRSSSTSYTPQSYSPMAPIESIAPDDISVPLPEPRQPQSFEAQAYVPFVAPEQPAATASFDEPPTPAQATETPLQGGNVDVEGPAQPYSGGYEPPTNSYEPPANSYEPPTSSYEPPAYQPYEPEAAEQDDEDEKPKPKKGPMYDDDDDDLTRRAEQLKKQQRSQADKEAEDAFRRAAEADAQKAPAKGKGWSLWPFKKDPNRADLGEKLSLVWDPELKRYVDKSNPSATQTPTASATPPPPRSSAPSSRVPSGMGLTPPPNSCTPPPMGMPRSVSTGAPPTSQPATSGPPSRIGTPGGGPLGPPGPAGLPGSKPGSTPTSRPPTRLSEASSIDDLLGAAGARKGGTVKGKKRGGRYVDVMAAKS